MYSRIATRDDLPSVVSLINAAFATENPFLMTTRTQVEEVEALMQKGHFLLLEEKGKMAGLIYAEILGEGRGYLGLLSIDPEVRRNGNGRLLVRAGEQFCREHGCHVVEGVVINLRPDLVERYQRDGFRVIGEAPGEDPSHVDRDYHFIKVEKDLY